MAERKTHEKFKQEVLELHPGIIICSTYINATTPMNFVCEQGHSFSMRPANILNGQYCKECFALRRSDSLRKGRVKNNFLWTTHPEIAQHLKNPDDGYKYSIGSSEKVEFVCPECGNTYFKQLHHIERHGLKCLSCSDGISFPNKLIYNVISLTGAKNIQPEWCPSWAKSYRYDLYFEYMNKKYIIEMDGGLGHGKRSYASAEIDINGVKTDQYKDKIAQEHDIVIVRIDSDYGNNDKYIFLKNEILHSCIAKLFSLEDIDWDQCFKKASSSMIALTAKLYNQGVSLKEMMKNLGYSNVTILKWLKQGTMLGLCKYDKTELKDRGLKRVSINQYTLDNNFIQQFDSIKDAARMNNISTTAIHYALSKDNHVSCGYKWYLSNDDITLQTQQND